MGNLTRNFSRHEFKCHCCGGVPSDEVLLQIARPLQALRDTLNEVYPGTRIEIRSGFRCKTHNKAIGGALHSRHMLGLAVDCHVPRMQPEEFAEWAAKIPEFEQSGIGVYPTWVHLDVGRSRRWRKK